MCSLASELIGVGVLHVERALEKVLGEGVDGVLGLLDADVLQALRQERHQVVLQVQPYEVRLRVQNVFLVLSVDFNVVLCLVLLLLFDYLLKVLFLFLMGDSLNVQSCLGHFVFLASLRLLLIVVGHVVEWLLVLLTQTQQWSKPSSDRQAEHCSSCSLLTLSM